MYRERSTSRAAKFPALFRVSGCPSPRTSRDPASASRQRGSASMSARGSMCDSCISMSARLAIEARVCG
eukprot:scaffold95929_cov28-Tisochrysis_lutea.AAC.1